MKTSQEMIDANKIAMDKCKPFYLQQFPGVAFYPLRQPQIMPRFNEEELREMYAKESGAPTNGK